MISDGWVSVITHLWGWLGLRNNSTFPNRHPIIFRCLCGIKIKGWENLWHRWKQWQKYIQIHSENTFKYTRCFVEWSLKYSVKEELWINKILFCRIKMNEFKEHSCPTVHSSEHLGWTIHNFFPVKLNCVFDNAICHKHKIKITQFDHWS